MIDNHMPNFKEKALCYDHDPKLWFPEEIHGNNKSWSRTPDAMKARKICNECPALMECRNYALAYSGLAGIWGGLDRIERTKLQEKLGITPLFILDTYDSTPFLVRKGE
jgi:WhiB family redox-sensing transcriptional regulator